jgi:hypothetical protein
MPTTYTHEIVNGAAELSDTSLKDLFVCTPTFATVASDITLPQASTVISRRTTVKNYSPDGQGYVNVHPYDGDNIDMGYERTLAVGEAITLQAIPGGWAIVGRA